MERKFFCSTTLWFLPFVLFMCVSSNTVWATSVVIVAQSPEGGVIETNYDSPHYSLVLYRSDGLTEVQHANLCEIPDHRTWSINADFIEGENAILKLWRMDNTPTGSTYYSTWDYWRNDPNRVEEVSMTITMHSGQTYTVTSKSSAVEGVVIVAQSPEGGVIETSYDLPHYSLVLYRGDGLTEVQHANLTHRQKVDAKIQDFLGGMGLTQDWM